MWASVPRSGCTSGSAARGFETYFLAEARSDDARRIEEMENEAVRFETPGRKMDRNDPLSFILSDMKQNEHLRESSDLAEIVRLGLERAAAISEVTGDPQTRMLRLGHALGYSYTDPGVSEVFAGSGRPWGLPHRTVELRLRIRFGRLAEQREDDDGDGGRREDAKSERSHWPDEGRRSGQGRN